MCFKKLGCSTEKAPAMQGLRVELGFMSGFAG